jgi:hypothetical protein
MVDVIAQHKRRRTHERFTAYCNTDESIFDCAQFQNAFKKDYEDVEQECTLIDEEGSESYTLGCLVTIDFVSYKRYYLFIKAGDSADNCSGTKNTYYAVVDCVGCEFIFRFVNISTNLVWKNFIPYKFLICGETLTMTELMDCRTIYYPYSFDLHKLSASEFEYFNQSGKMLYY